MKELADPSGISSGVRCKGQDVGDVSFLEFYNGLGVVWKRAGLDADAKGKMQRGETRIMTTCRPRRWRDCLKIFVGGQGQKNGYWVR